MRKSIITTLLLLLAVTCTFAQPERGQHKGGQALLEELNLSPEQQEQIKAIKQDTRQQLRALRQDQPAAGREQTKAIHEQSRKAVEAVFTPEQQAKLAELKATKKAAWDAVDKQALKAELQTYKETNIEPVLRASRSKLDAFISADDQAEIERLRAVFAERKGEQKRGARRVGQQDKPAAMVERREAGKAWRTEHSADLESLKLLADKYQAELKRVQDILAPSRETWGADMAEIKAKYLPEGMDKGGRKMHKAEARKSPKGKRGGTRVDRMKAGAFLLLKS